MGICSLRDYCDCILEYNHSRFRLLAAMVFFSNLGVFHVKFNVYIIFWFVIMVDISLLLVGYYSNIELE